MKKYLLLEERDRRILEKCNQLEKLNLRDEDKILVKLIKTQLEKDWRKPLLQALNQLLKRYKNNLNNR